MELPFMDILVADGAQFNALTPSRFIGAVYGLRWIRIICDVASFLLWDASVLDIIEYQKRLGHLVYLANISKMQSCPESRESKFVKDGILLVENSSLLIIKHSKTLLVEEEIYEVINLNELAEVGILVLQESHL